MGNVVTGFTMSLDGFIAALNGDIGTLFKWYYSGDTEVPLEGTGMTFKMSAASARYFNSLAETTGAIVTGRGDFDVSRAWGGKPPFNVPTFVVTHNPPQDWLKPDSPFTFVTDGVESAIVQAKQVVGNRNVVVGGTQIVQQAIKAGLIDEIFIELASMLLGDGISLFGHLGQHVTLERLSVTEGTDVTHLHYRVVK
ncbi:MAG: dihydrofolate reductase family protein [Chloroflexi bacterium]|nr:dihydrofolate reductase family protein [Chloroflexota bacterium]